MKLFSVGRFTESANAGTELRLKESLSFVVSFVTAIAQIRDGTAAADFLHTGALTLI
jgi:hypothetical protein